MSLFFRCEILLGILSVFVCWSQPKIWIAKTFTDLWTELECWKNIPFFADNRICCYTSLSIDHFISLARRHTHAGYGYLTVYHYGKMTHADRLNVWTCSIGANVTPNQYTKGTERQFGMRCALSLSYQRSLNNSNYWALDHRCRLQSS